MEMQACLEDLGGVSLYVSPVHTLNEDSLLLAAFSAEKYAKSACDFGTGCGVLPMLWCKRPWPGSITGVELDEEAVGLFSRSITYNGLEKRVRAVHADLAVFAAQTDERYDLVAMNPPYFKAGSGRVSVAAQTRIARHEYATTLETICNAASRVLHNRGRLCLCLPPGRLCDVLCAMRAAAIEPKRLRFVSSFSGDTPRLVMVEGMLCAGAGLVVEAPLYTKEPDGTRSVMMQDYLDGSGA